MKTKGSIIILFSVLFLLLSCSAFAAATTNGISGVESVLSQIRQEQMVSNNSEIIPALVNKTLLSELGTAVLDRGYPSALIDREVNLAIDGGHYEGTVAIGYDYLATQWMSKKGSVSAALTGLNWAKYGIPDQYMPSK